jgi:hypothetical protein
MKKEVAKKWIQALRSGKYKQGKGFLKHYNNKNEPRYCCLGVLCELYNNTMKKNHKKTLEVKTCDDDDSLKHGYVRFSGKDGSSATTLPASVKNWSGINSVTGTFKYNTNNRWEDINTECLSDMNDDGITFKAIANAIEKNMESL